MKSLADVIEQEEIENKGVEVPFAGGFFGCAAVGNPGYNKKRIALEKKFRRSNSVPANKELEEELAEEVQRRACFGEVVTSWRGEPFEFDADAFAALQTQMLSDFGQSIPDPPNPPAGGRGLLPFTEGNFLWYMERSKRFRRSVFLHASAEDTFNKENLEILGKASAK